MVFSGGEDRGGAGESASSEKEAQCLYLSPADLRRVGWEACGLCRGALSASVPPKLLPCLHAVCTACFTRSSEQGNSRDCPVCSQSFHLSEVNDCLIFEESLPKCGGCEESALSSWCVQCEEALCSDCVLAHQRVKMTRNHRVIPQEHPSGFTAGLRCAAHKHERLKFFCLKCDELTCRDCQLMNHRGHSFLLLEEALVSQKEHLQRLLHSIRDQKISVEASLLDLNGRLQNLKESKATAKKKMLNLVQSIHLMLLTRGHQLFKEVKGQYEEEEKSLMEMKKTLLGLEKRQKYITAFIQKILSTEGQCILLHKKQILKQVEGLLSQNTSLSKTILQPQLHLNKDLFQICKTFGSLKTTRVPLTSTKKCMDNSNTNSVAKEDGCLSDLNFNSVPASQSFTSPESESTSAKHLAAQPTQMLSNNILPLVDMPNYVQSKVPSVSHADALSVPSNYSLVQATQSKTAQSVLAQVSNTVPHSATSHISHQPLPSKRVLRSLSDPRPHRTTSHNQTPIPGQSLLKNLVFLPVKHSSTKSMPGQPQPPQHGDVPAAASHLSFTSSLAHHSVSLHAASELSNSSDAVPPKHPSRTLKLPGNISVLSLSALPSSARIRPGISDPQQNILTGHRQQNFPISQSITVLPAPLQPLPSNRHPQIFTTSGSLPVSQVLSSSTANTVILQDGQQAVFQSSPLLFTLLKDSSALHHLTPVANKNQMPVLTQPVLLTTPVSVPVVGVATTCSSPNMTISSTSRENEKSRQQVSSQVSSPAQPTAPDITAFRGISNKELNTVSRNPPIPAAQIVFTSNNQGQSKFSQKPKCELPVQAPADSLGDSDIRIHGRASPSADEPDDNLPTSTVPEMETKELAAAQDLCLCLSPSPELISATSVSGCPSSKGSLSLPKSQLSSTLTMSFTDGTPASRHWSFGMPTSLRQILELTDVPASKKEGVGSEDTLPTSDSEHTSLQNVMQNDNDDDDDDDEETDISDSEPVQGEVAAIMPERDFELAESSNRSLCVSLLQLPISLPASGSPLPQFHIVYDRTGEILLREIQDSKPVQKWLRIPAPPEAASLSQSSAEYPQLNNLLDCAVCLSAGATLLCAECGRSFHTNCHVPPVLFRPIEVWVCSLCQDVFDDIDPFKRDRLKEPYLSLQDQRRCEQLLLTLMCEQHSYLLYNTTKRTAGCVEFDFIRGRLLGKRNPPYRSAAELVSDLWTLFEILLANSKKRNLVLNLQNSFQERLKIAFGKSLHASLLRPPSREGLKRAPEAELGKAEAKNTLQRMREYLAENCATLPKKPRTDS